MPTSTGDDNGGFPWMWLFIGWVALSALLGFCCPKEVLQDPCGFWIQAFRRVLCQVLRLDTSKYEDETSNQEATSGQENAQDQEAAQYPPTAVPITQIDAVLVKEADAVAHPMPSAPPTSFVSGRPF